MVPPIKESRPRVYLTGPQVRQRYGGRSASWLDNRSRDPNFPKPIYIGRRRFYALDELEAMEGGAS
jgi:predicted DNA-binding transcriptional regulator AlpA